MRVRVRVNPNGGVLRHPARTDVEDTRARGDVLLIVVGQAAHGTLVDVVHQPWRRVKVAVVLLVLPLERLGRERVLLRPLAREELVVERLLGKRHADRRLDEAARHHLLAHHLDLVINERVGHRHWPRAWLQPGEDLGAAGCRAAADEDASCGERSAREEARRSRNQHEHRQGLETTLAPRAPSCDIKKSRPAKNLCLKEWTP